MGVRWAEFDGGYMGILACGLTIALARINEGPFAGAYRVRFANVESEIQQWNPDTAKEHGIRLARRVMTDCLCDLERALDENGTEPTVRIHEPQGTSPRSGEPLPGTVHGHYDANPERKPVQPAAVPSPFRLRPNNPRKSGKKEGK